VISGASRVEGGEVPARRWSGAARVPFFWSVGPIPKWTRPRLSASQKIAFIFLFKKCKRVIHMVAALANVSLVSCRPCFYWSVHLAVLRLILRTFRRWHQIWSPLNISCEFYKSLSVRFRWGQRGGCG
jgi:hypothetical protein